MTNISSSERPSAVAASIGENGMIIPDGPSADSDSTSQCGSAGKIWGRRDLNPDRRVSPTRGATHACLANHGSALQSVITGQQTRSQSSPCLEPVILPG